MCTDRRLSWAEWLALAAIVLLAWLCDDADASYWPDADACFADGGTRVRLTDERGGAELVCDRGEPGQLPDFLFRHDFED
jgi:hypothetical protein